MTDPDPAPIDPAPADPSLSLIQNSDPAPYKWGDDVPEKFKDKQPGDVLKAYGELEKRFGGFSGAPEEYALNVPEGFEGEFDKEDPILTGFSEIAKEANMNQETYDKCLSLYLGNMFGDPEAAIAAEMSALGKGGDMMIKDVDDYLRANLEGADYQEVIAGLTTAASIKSFHKLIGLTTPKAPPIEGGENPDGLSKEKWEEMRFAKTESGERRMSVDPDYKKLVDDYGRRLMGQDSP